MRTAVVVVGNELLAGHTADANGPWLAQRLRSMGHELAEIAIVPDAVERIAEALERLSPTCELLFACGGLGPTLDDLTIDAVARFLGRDLKVAPDARAQVERVYRKAHAGGLIASADVDEAAWRMARIPEGGTVIPNDVGVAPGSLHRFERGDASGTLVVLPGPPREMHSVFENLRRAGLLPVGETAYEAEVHVRSFEAPIADALARLGTGFPDVRIGSYPQHREVRVIVRLTGERKRVEEAAAALRAAIGHLEMERGDDA